MKRNLWGEVDAAGRVVLPEEVASRYGLTPGSRIMLTDAADMLTLHRPVNQLEKLYLELTNQCNLACRTCVRNVWAEAPGWMSAETFSAVLDGLKAFSPLPSVFLGGYGEPLSHPDALEMIARLKRMGIKVELITNATLLDEPTARALVEMGLDTLWVSLDGATPQSYADVRLAEALPLITENLARLRDLRLTHFVTRPHTGIVFVALKRNISDLPDLLELGARLGASRFMISNVLAHTAELRDEILYHRTLDASDDSYRACHPAIYTARMDLNQATQSALLRVMQAGSELGFKMRLCPFISRGSASLRWDGALSPCLPLLHSHKSYLGDRERTSSAYSVGNIAQQSLAALWNDPGYVSLRAAVQAFDFSPCATCNSCEMADSNQEDCFGNVYPVCGGCLWAHGIIQCP